MKKDILAVAEGTIIMLGLIGAGFGIGQLYSRAHPACQKIIDRGPAKPNKDGTFTIPACSSVRMDFDVPVGDGNVGGNWILENETQHANHIS